MSVAMKRIARTVNSHAALVVSVVRIFNPINETTHSQLTASSSFPESSESNHSVLLGAIPEQTKQIFAINDTLRVIRTSATVIARNGEES